MGQNTSQFYKIKYEDSLFHWTTYTKVTQFDQGLLIANSYTVQKNPGQSGIGIYSTIDTFQLLEKSIYIVQNGKKKCLVNRHKAFGDGVILKNNEGSYEYAFFPDSIEKRRALLILQSRSCNGFWLIPYPSILIKGPVLSGVSSVSPQSIVQIDTIDQVLYHGVLHNLLTNMFEDEKIVSHFKDEYREIYVLTEDHGDMSIFKKLTIHQNEKTTIELYLNVDSALLHDEDILQIAMGDTNLVYSKTNKGDQVYFANYTSGFNVVALEYGKLNKYYYSVTYSLKQSNIMLGLDKKEVQYLFKLGAWKSLLFTPKLGFIVFPNYQEQKNIKIDQLQTKMVNKFIESLIFRI